MIIHFKNPPTDISYTTALVCAAMPELYPIFGKFACLDISLDLCESPPVMWRHLQAKMAEVLNRFPHADHMVICDASMNSPELVDARRVCLMVITAASRSVERRGGYYTLARLRVGVVEVEYRPHIADESAI